MNQDERELQAYFDDLRRSEALGAPSFARVLNGESTLLKSRGWVWALAGCLALALSLAIIVTRQVRTPRPPAISITEWKSPTESLLRVPRDPLLTTVPRVESAVPPLQPSMVR